MTPPLAVLGAVVVLLSALLDKATAATCYANFGAKDFPSCINLAPSLALHWSVSGGSITFAADVDGGV